MEIIKRSLKILVHVAIFPLTLFLVIVKYSNLVSNEVIEIIK